jgi:hypothetical protein
MCEVSDVDCALMSTGVCYTRVKSTEERHAVQKNTEANATQRTAQLQGHSTHNCSAGAVNTKLSCGAHQLSCGAQHLSCRAHQLSCMFSTHLGFLRRKIPSHGSVLYLCDRGDTWSQSGEDVLQSQIAAWVRERGRA